MNMAVAGWPVSGLADVQQALAQTPGARSVTPNPKNPKTLNP